MRLILGVDAEKRVQQAEAARAAEAEKWRHLTVSTVFEDGLFDSRLNMAKGSSGPAAKVIAALLRAALSILLCRAEQLLQLRFLGRALSPSRRMNKFCSVSHDLSSAEPWIYC